MTVYDAQRHYCRCQTRLVALPFTTYRVKSGPLHEKGYLYPSDLPYFIPLSKKGMSRYPPYINQKIEYRPFHQQSPYLPLSTNKGKQRNTVSPCL